MNNIRVILIDDQQAVHDTVSALMKTVDDMSLVAQGYRGEEAVDLCNLCHPDLLLMDVVLPSISGIEATKLVRKRFPKLKVLALSSFREYEYIKEMLDNGATGYLVKDALVDDLINTIRATHQGITTLSPEVTQLILSPPSPDTQQDFGLTAREYEVLQLMAEGRNNGQIAKALDISIATVRFHVVNLLQKMNVETRSEALVLAAKIDLV